MDYSDLKPDSNSVPINSITVPFILDAVRESLASEDLRCEYRKVELLWGYDRKGYLNVGPVHKVTNRSYQQKTNDLIILQVTLAVNRESIIDDVGWDTDSAIAKLHRQHVNILTVAEQQELEEKRKATLKEIEELEEKITKLKMEI